MTFVSFRGMSFYMLNALELLKMRRINDHGKNRECVILVDTEVKPRTQLTSSDCSI